MSTIKLDKTVRAVAHPDTNEIITAGTKNPEWGSVRVQNQVLVNNGNGLITLQTRVAFVRMQMNLATELIKMNLLKDGKQFPMEGRIIVKESFEPFYDNQTPKINPQTQETILFNGMPVYRQSLFVTDENSKDELITDYIANNPIGIVHETVGGEVPVEQEVG